MDEHDWLVERFEETGPTWARSLTARSAAEEAKR
jgi:hypothetical protein